MSGLLRIRLIEVLVCGAILALLSLWTFERNALWSDARALWVDNCLKSPAKSRPYVNLARELYEAGRVDEATAVAWRACQLNPRLLELFKDQPDLQRLRQNRDWDR